MVWPATTVEPLTGLAVLATVTVPAVGVTTHAVPGHVGSTSPVFLARLRTSAVVTGVFTVALTTTCRLAPAGTVRPVQLMVWPEATPPLSALTNVRPALSTSLRA
ncbi:hypothetical protein D3C86_1720300 [compost metagenome]